MKRLSVLHDRRILASNILFELTIEEFLNMARVIIANNPFQRKRVKSSSSVYSLLRDDLKSGCVIPPLVLALSEEEQQTAPEEDIAFSEFIMKNLAKVLIIDGLQRTNTIIDAEEELKSRGDSEVLSIFYQNNIRCELYIGIDKLGILYRMLTLNTGQTPMSLRHQIEILYSDYLSKGIEGIKLIREIDEERASGLTEYNFKNVIEGFTSYLQRDFLTFDRSDILENIKSLEKLSKENQGYDIFVNYLKAYHSVFNQIVSLSNNWKYEDEQIEVSLIGPPFGKDASKIFKKSQVMTGFGAAVGFLKDKDLIKGFDDIIRDTTKIKFGNIDSNALYTLCLKLDEIRRSAPKIGNAQRAYFYYFFRELFNSSGDSYLSIDEAIENAYVRYLQNA